MAPGERDTVICRMARVAREEYQARAMSPAKALRLALAQSADALFDLPMVITAVEQVEVSQTSLRAEFGAGGLLMLLDGPHGARGAVRVDPALLAALIEVQTTGRVTGRLPGDRALTRTDAAMVAPLIDEALERAGAQLGAGTPDHWMCGYRFGVMMEDARGMSLALDAPAFHVFRMMVEMGDGAHPGAISVLLPVSGANKGATPGAPADHVGGTLERSAMDAPVTLHAVMGRLTLPLDKAGRLKVGDVLEFGVERGMRVRLEASQKHVVALARLGQVNGARAVRLSAKNADHLPPAAETAADGGASQAAEPTTPDPSGGSAPRAVASASANGSARAPEGPVPQPDQPFASGTVATAPARQAALEDHTAV